MPSVFFFKQIKPARFRDREMYRVIRNAVYRVARRAKTDYERTTRTWDMHPKFELVTSITKGGPTFLLGTDDKIYKFIDEGTSVRYAHMPPDYVQKTVPGLLTSFPGGSSKRRWIDVSDPQPGIAPRGFSEMIHAKYEKVFPREMEKAMREAARISGHGK
jgi:hypothetical protein